ncbi:MAG: NnrS family protein [Candidatus Thiodiazotropha sp. (ex Ctena orbiculata)]|nr:NnrS family protein [Candidatus Thiodiazotropha taylori]
MSVIPLGERPAPSQPPKGFVPFALGFRPFFALAGFSGLLLMIIWIAYRHLAKLPSPYFSPIDWHSHEMLFGFSMAIIAGFLLTAVRNWTGLETPSGKPLALLSLLWLAGRLLPLAPSLPVWLISLVDWLFIPALIMALAPPLIQGENRINRIFLPLLGGMAFANLLFHLQILGAARTGAAGISLMLNLILLLLIFVSGRVLPFFIEKAVTGATPRFSKRREQIIYALLMLWILAELLLPGHALFSLLALGIALTQAWRILDWYHPAIWRLPMLWVLYSGLIWLSIGFTIKALALLGLYPHNLATHALTVGAIGLFTLGMMARVALGHTGREMRPNRSMVIAFVLMNVAIVVRLVIPVTGVIGYELSIALSGALWIVSFLLFLITYLPILLLPRIDGRPG